MNQHLMVCRKRQVECGLKIGFLPYQGQSMPWISFFHIKKMYKWSKTTFLLPIPKCKDNNDALKHFKIFFTFQKNLYGNIWNYLLSFVNNYYKLRNEKQFENCDKQHRKHTYSFSVHLHATANKTSQLR